MSIFCEKSFENLITSLMRLCSVTLFVERLSRKLRTLMKWYSMEEARNGDYGESTLDASMHCCFTGSTTVCLGIILSDVLERVSAKTGLRNDYIYTVFFKIRHWNGLLSYTVTKILSIRNSGLA